MVTLAFLNLGPTEVLLIILLFVVLFGADKAPEIARNLGRARTELDKVRGEVTQAMKSEEDRALDDQLKFERARDHHMAQQNVEGVQLRRAAEELGIDITGMDDDAVKRAIAGHVGATEPVLEEESAKKAADAQQ